MKKRKNIFPAVVNPIAELNDRRDHAQNLSFEATHWINNSIDKLAKSTDEAAAAVEEANAMIAQLEMNVKTLNAIIETNSKLIKNLEALLGGEN